MILTTTLSAAAAAAIINIWLIVRCGQVRVSAKIVHGDGGNPLLARRMRAHANFIENTPLVLILIGVAALFWDKHRRGHFFWETPEVVPPAIETPVPTPAPATPTAG